MRRGEILHLGAPTGMRRAACSSFRRSSPWSVSLHPASPGAR